MFSIPLIYLYQTEFQKSKLIHSPPPIYFGIFYYNLLNITTNTLKGSQLAGVMSFPNRIPFDFAQGKFTGVVPFGKAGCPQLRGVFGWPSSNKNGHQRNGDRFIYIDGVPNPDLIGTAAGVKGLFRLPVISIF